MFISKRNSRAIISAKFIVVVPFMIGNLLCQGFLVGNFVKQLLVYFETVVSLRFYYYNNYNDQ